MNIADKILEACISSARAEPLKLVQRGGKIKRIRSQLHVRLLLPFGGGKGTMIKEHIPTKLVMELDEYTKPGLLGSIDKDGDYIKGAAAKAAGKCLVIDEFHNLTDNARNSLLKLLEMERATRNLGRNVKKPYSSTSRSRGLRVRARDNILSIESRFSCLLSGIYVRYKHINDHAFNSRSMPLTFDETLPEAFDFVRGGERFRLKPRPFFEVPVFEDYLKFVDMYEVIYKKFLKDNRKMLDFYLGKSGYFKRNIGDFARFFAYLSCNNSTVVDWEQWCCYIPLFMYNHVASTLTLSEFEILQDLNSSKNQREIAKGRGVTDSAVSQVIKKLRGLGLA